MPLFTKNTVIAALLAIPVLGSAVIGASYQSVILHHLVDIVNGSKTQTVVSLNAPNWSEGIPLSVPVGTAAATSTSGGTVASSTAFTFAVAALDNTGTTTIGTTATVSTDASTSPNEEIQVSWAAVPGATGYAVYFATSSTATTFSQYFLATSTNGTPNTSYTFGTSTGSIAGSPGTDSTAFATEINSNGTSYLDAGPLQVNAGANQTSGYFYGSNNNFLQLVTHNTNGGNNASADFVACNNLSRVLGSLGPNCPNYYFEFGINSSAFSQAGFNGEAANDSFITSSDSNLDIETASSTGPANINFLIAGTQTQNVLGVMTPAGRFAWGTTTPAATFQATATTSNATTTVELGKSGQSKGTCLKLYRTDGTAVYAYVIAGATAFTLSTSANICSSVTGF